MIEAYERISKASNNIDLPIPVTPIVLVDLIEGRAVKDRKFREEVISKAERILSQTIADGVTQ